MHNLQLGVSGCNESVQNSLTHSFTRGAITGIGFRPLRGLAPYRFTILKCDRARERKGDVSYGQFSKFRSSTEPAYSASWTLLGCSILNWDYNHAKQVLGFVSLARLTQTERGHQPQLKWPSVRQAHLWQVNVQTHLIANTLQTQTRDCGKNVPLEDLLYILVVSLGRKRCTFASEDGWKWDNRLGYVGLVSLVPRLTLACFHCIDHTDIGPACRWGLRPYAGSLWISAICRIKLLLPYSNIWGFMKSPTRRLLFVPSGFYGKYRAVLDDDDLDHVCLTLIKFRGNCGLTAFSFISCPSLKMYPNDSCCHIRLAWQSICVSCCRGPHRRFLPILAGVQPRFLGCTSTLVSCWYATVFWWTSEPFLIPSRDLGEFKVTVCGLKSGELVLNAVLASRYVPVTAELPKLRSDFLILSGFQVW